MKILISTLFTLVCAHLSFSQDWSVVEKNDFFSISVDEITYENLTDGINHQRLIFKYENHSDKPITLTFNRELFFSESDKVIQEQTFSISIPANSTVEYGDINLDKTFYLFKTDNLKFIKKSLIDFKLINLRLNE